MSRPVLILTVTSLVLGASTVYLAVELRATRQELASLRGSSAAATPVAAVTPLAASDTRAATAGDTGRPASIPTRHPRRGELTAARDAAAQRAATLLHDSYVRALKT
jgi:hypothetical protein